MLPPEEAPIDIFADKQPKDQIDIFAKQPMQLPLEVANQRAVKAYFGMEDFSVDPQSLGVQISQGNERRMREMMARERDLAFRKQKHQFLLEEMKNREGPMSNQEIQFYMGLSEKHVTNPDTVFEDGYAEKFLQTALTLNEDDNSLREALDEDPEAANSIVDQGKWLLVRKELTQGVLEDLENEYSKKGTIRKVEDTIEQFVPLLSSARMGNLPGQGMEERINELLLMPPEQFAVELKKDVDEIKKGSYPDAIAYAQRVMGYSLSDQALDTVFLGLDVADIATLGVGGLVAKGAKGIAKKVSRETVTETVEGVDAVVIGKQRKTFKPHDPTSHKQYLDDDKGILLTGPLPSGVSEDDLLKKGKIIKVTDPEGVEHIIAYKKGFEKDAKRLAEMYRTKAGFNTAEFHTEVGRILQYPEEDIKQFVDQGIADGIYTQRSSALLRLANTVKEAVKAGGSRELDPAGVAAAVGDVERAAVVDTLQRWKRRLWQLDPLLKGKELYRHMPSIMNPNSMLRGATRLTTNMVVKLENELMEQGAKLIQAATEPSQATRLGDNALLVATEVALNSLKQKYNHLNDSILDVAPPVTFDKLTNTYGVNIALGKTHGQLFDTAEQAAVVASRDYGLDPDSFTVQRQGEKHYINIRKDIDETLGAVRDQLVIETDNQTPVSIANMTFGWGRTPEDVLSTLNRENRHGVTHGAQEVLNLVGQVSKSIGNLNFKAKKRLNRVLQENRDFLRKIEGKDGVVRTVRGRYWNTVGEFERGYYEVTGQFPTYKDTKAYFTARQLNDFSYMMLNYSLYRDKARMGIAQYRFQIQKVDEDGKVVRDNTRYFEGKEAEQLPIKKDYGIAVYNHDTGETGYYRYENLKGEEKEYINSLMTDKGYKLLQIANGLEKPLAENLGVPDTINMMVVRDFESKPLDHAQINYRPGGPVIYSDEFYAKQGRIRETTYGAHEFEGDISVRSFSSEAKADEYTALLEQARLMLRDQREGKPAGVAIDEAAIREVDAEIEKLKKVPSAPLIGQTDAAFKINGKIYHGLEHTTALMKAVADIGEEAVEKALGFSVDEVLNNKHRTSDLFGFVDEQGRNFLPVKEWAKLTQTKIKSEGAEARITYLTDKRKALRGEKTSGAWSFDDIKPKVTPASAQFSPKEVQDFIRNKLGEDPADFMKQFLPQKDKDGNVVGPPKLSLDVPFTKVRAKQGTNDVLKDEYRKMFARFEDSWDDDLNLYRDINKKHTGEREVNLPSVRAGDPGSEDTPLFSLKEPRLLDPMSSIKKQASHFMRARFMDDYEISSMESFIQEFGDLMEGSLDELRRNPMMALKRPQWKDNVDKERLWSAKAARIAILNLLGTPGVVGQFTDALKHKMFNFIYNKAPVVMGRKNADVVTDWVADKFIGTLEDPLAYARNIAFHTKMGLLNPVQLILQAQTFTHILALSPQYAVQSAYGGILMRYMMSYGHESIPKHFAKMASKFGWTPEDFMESFEELRKTGLWHVEGEQAFRDDTFQPKLFNGKMGRALDAGLIFFREAERYVRMTAWNAAYKEWKAKNPGKKIGNKERNAILRRSNDLSVNMTRASNSSWQQGPLSIPTQFFGYQARLWEQFMGKRLTKHEKVRAFMIYSLMYGMPTATTVAGGVYGAIAGGIQGGVLEGKPVSGAGAGAMGGLWPFNESMRKAAMEKGWDIDHPMFEAFLDGIPATMLEMITGADMNVSERYGPGGLRLLKEAFVTGESGLSDVIFGASGSILKDMITSFEPSLKAMYGVFSEEQGEYPITFEDVLDQLSNISTINNFAKAWYAYNTGKYYTKNEIYIGDVNGWDTFFMGMTGLTPQKLTDTFLMIESNSAIREVQDAATKQAIKYIRRGYSAESNEERLAAFTAAKVHLVGAGIPPHEWHDIMMEAFNGHTSLVDKIRNDFYFTKVPVEDMEARQKRFMEDYGE